MKINLITIGNKMPSWVIAGFNEYKKRLNQEVTLVLTEIAPLKRTKTTDMKSVTDKEGDMMLQVAVNHKLIILDIPGKQWDTYELAKQIESWKHDGRDIAILIGGPEGLSDKCKQMAEQSWSLSRLTLPHPMVRVVVAEALYRAWSVNHNHPYHRE